MAQAMQSMIKVFVDAPARAGTRLQRAQKLNAGPQRNAVPMVGYEVCCCGVAQDRQLVNLRCAPQIRCDLIKTEDPSEGCAFDGFAGRALRCADPQAGRD
mgnify:CR=1 FL=1